MKAAHSEAQHTRSSQTCRKDAFAANLSDQTISAEGAFPAPRVASLPRADVAQRAHPVASSRLRRRGGARPQRGRARGRPPGRPPAPEGAPTRRVRPLARAGASAQRASLNVLPAQRTTPRCALIRAARPAARRRPSLSLFARCNVQAERAQGCGRRRPDERRRHGRRGAAAGVRLASHQGPRQQRSCGSRCGQPAAADEVLEPVVDGAQPRRASRRAVRAALLRRPGARAAEGAFSAARGFRAQTEASLLRRSRRPAARRTRSRWRWASPWRCLTPRTRCSVRG